MVHALNFQGHGDEPLRHKGLHMEQLADDVLAYIEAQALTQVHLFGYSMGGYVALTLASRYPDVVQRVFTLATKFAWSPEVAAQEVRGLNAERIAQKVPHFAQQLQERHSALGWRQVLQETRELLLELGERPVLTPERLQQVPHPVRISLGDRDAMVSLEETVATYRALPQGELQIFPTTPHPFEKVAIAPLAQAMQEFFGAAG